MESLEITYIFEGMLYFVKKKPKLQVGSGKTERVGWKERKSSF